jgi:glycosyltransferase involved in cell wall biosynthesis
MAYNEEASIERCLRSVAGMGDEILVLDSFSTDHTAEIAKACGARVVQHPFTSFADQRRELIRLASHDWIFILDADECVSDELRSSVMTERANKSVDAFTSNRRNQIGYTWLRHGSWYPDRKIRMFDRRKVTVAGHDIHESIQPLAEARIGHLEGDLLHYADTGISSRFQKVNSYSTRAAAGLFRQGRTANLLRILFKPFIRFFSVYVLRLGFLDGYYGFIIARSEAHYVWLREIKLWELHHTSSRSSQKKTS